MRADIIGVLEAWDALDMANQPDPERAKIDAKAATDFGRVAAQSAILINGGAATAILALIGSITRDLSGAKALLPLIPVPLTIYALGVLSAACALLPMSMALDCYMTKWEQGGEKGEDWGKRGENRWHIGLAFVAAALLCFIVATTYVACVLAHLD